MLFPLLYLHTLYSFFLIACKVTSHHSVLAGQVGRKKTASFYWLCLSGSQLVFFSFCLYFFVTLCLSFCLFFLVSLCFLSVCLSSVCFSSVKLSVIIFSLCHAFYFIIWWNLIWFDLLMLPELPMANLQFVKIHPFKTGFSNLLTAHNNKPLCIETDLSTD